MTPADISIVIPAINEQDAIATSIESAIAAGATEIIVSDGGSRDDTVANAKAAGATKLVASLPGRGIQLNAGAFVAQREYLLFLHADNVLAADCLQQICDEEAEWGAFRQRIDADGFRYRMLEWGNALRVTWRGVPFGDQAIFVRRALYKQQGGFPEIPLMEDVALSKTLRKVAKPKLLDGPVTISARRWQTKGVVRQTLLNWRLQIAYACGASPESLKKRYK